MNVLVILNPLAGSAAAGASDLDAVLGELFERHGVEALIQHVDAAHIPDAVTKARADGMDAVIAGGGDGTIGSVAGALAGTGTPLGVLPLGTFNHFAKDAGIPLDLEEAVRTIAGGVTRDVDIGEVNGHLFLNNSSIGAYPAAVLDRDRQRVEKGRRKLLAMVIAVLRVFRMRPFFPVRLTIDGEPLRRRTPFVFIGNNIYRPRWTSGPLRDRLDEGLLCVITAKTTGILCLVRLLWDALLKRSDRSRYFEYLQGREVRIDPRGKTVRVACDGEVLTLEAPLYYRVRRGALRVIVTKPILP